MSQDDLDRCEEAAIKRAEAAAYLSTEGVNPAVQHKIFKTMYTFITTGIRLMREEIEKQYGRQEI